VRVSELISNLTILVKAQKNMLTPIVDNLPKDMRKKNKVEKDI